MAQPQTQHKELSAAEAAKLVARDVIKTEDGKPVLDKAGKPVMAKKPIGADEVLSWKDYGDHVMVVTKDGQKFKGVK